MHYLLLGEDNLSKDLEIETIKKDLLSRTTKNSSYNDALHFDYESLTADKLDPAEFKKSLIALPSIAQRRGILVRNIHKLSPQNKKILLDFLEEKNDYLTCIFESSESEIKNAFFKSLSKWTNVQLFKGEEHVDVFDVTNAISRKKPQEALKTLRELLLKGDHPLKIMGGLIWFWGRNRGRVSREKFSKGLKFLQEADLNIKRTRLSGDNALELLIVKLCSLIT